MFASMQMLPTSPFLSYFGTNFEGCRHCITLFVLASSFDTLLARRDAHAPTNPRNFFHFEQHWISVLLFTLGIIVLECVIKRHVYLHTTHARIFIYVSRNLVLNYNAEYKRFNFFIYKSPYIYIYRVCTFGW